MSRGIVVVLLVLAFAGGFTGWPWQAKPQFWTSRPTRQPQVAVTRVDLPGWYYGQWYWSQVFDWWTPR